MKKLILLIVLAGIAFGCFIIINIVRENYSVNQLRVELFDIAGGMKEDLSNKDKVIDDVIAAAAQRRFEVDRQDIKVDSHVTGRMNTAQSIISNIVKFTNYENTIKTRVVSKWLFYRSKIFDIDVYHIVQKQAEQKMHPMVKEMLEE